MSSLLTEAGERLYEHALDIVSKSIATSATLAEIRERGISRLPIAMSSSLTGPALSDQLAKFSRRHPSLRLSIHSGADDEVLRLVRRGTVQCGIFGSLGQVPGLASSVFGSDELVFVVAASHPLARKRRPTRESFRDVCLVGPVQGSNFDSIIDQAFRRIGLTRPGMSMEVREPSTLIDLVLHGAGMAVSSFRRVRDQLVSGKLAALDFNCPAVRVEIRWAASPAKPLSPIGSELTAYLEQSRIFKYPPLSSIDATRVRIY
jgi:DNA-binding transcriptional LysR family regulator